MERVRVEKRQKYTPAALKKAADSPTPDTGQRPQPHPPHSDLAAAITHPSTQTLTPDVVQRLQQTHGNAFVQRLVRRAKSAVDEDESCDTCGAQRQIQRAPAEIRRDDAKPLTPMEKVKQALKKDQEETAIKLIAVLEPQDARTMLYSDEYRNLATDAFDNDEMYRAMWKWAMHGDTQMFGALIWMFDEGSDWDKMRKVLNKAPDDKGKEYTRQSDWMLEHFVDICNDEEMAVAVDLLRGTIAEKLKWMIAEGTNKDLVYNMVRHTPDDKLVKSTDPTIKPLLPKLKDEIGKNGVISFQQMLDRGLLYWEGIDTKYEEQHYELANEKKPDEGWELKEFTGKTAYEIQMTRSKLIIIVGIKPEPASDVKKEDVEKQIPVWTEGIKNRWNEHFHIEGPRHLSIDVVPQIKLDHSDPDHKVNIEKPSKDPREDQTHWFVKSGGYNTDGDTAAHEFGHMVGMEDEYRLTKADFQRLVGREPTKADQDPNIGYTDTGLMDAGHGDAQGRHFRPFLKWLNKHTTPDKPYRIEPGK